MIRGYRYIAPSLNNRHDFNEDEQGLCIKCVSLQTKSTASGRKAFIAVGTGYFRGEDVGMRGTVCYIEFILARNASILYGF